jgi:hypothetical protein
MSTSLLTLLLLDDAVGKFDPDQPRDEEGKWTDGGGSGGVGGSEHVAQDRAFTESEKEAIANYAGDWYQDINRRLRGERLEEGDYSEHEVDQTIKALDSAMEKSTLKESMVVYRGMDAEALGGLQFNRDLPGTVITPGTFVSTSRSRAIAEEFAGYKNVTRPVILELSLPKGIHALEPASVSNMDKRFQEITLNRKVKFKVTGWTPGSPRTKKPHVVRVTAYE